MDGCRLLFWKFHSNGYIVFLTEDVQGNFSMESMDEVEKKQSLQKGRQLIEFIVDRKDGKMFKVVALVCVWAECFVNTLKFGWTEEKQD